MKFDILNLHPDILKGINEVGFEQCTPIQEQSLPECLAGKDVIAQSQTGSGKTAVFLLTVFSRAMAAGPSATGQPRALVMVPTRELATQVIDDAVKLGKYLPFRSVAIYGGVEYDKQVQALKKGVELVVATPGRMIDLYKSKTLSLDSIEIFVIDEADRMFDMGFAPDIMYIAGRLPKNKPRQTMLFSATIDSNVRRLASRYMLPDPVMIEIEPEQVTVNTIDQKVLYVSNEEKLSMLLSLLKRPDVERCIIFTNMKRTAEMLGWKLEANGLPAKVLTGDLSQERRQKVIEAMKAGKLKMLVATDVAARGLHIEGITHVINYDLPDDAANYVHRIGRTARAGKSGKAYSLACEDHVLNLPEIEKYIERKLEAEWIEDSEIVKDTAPRYSERARGPKPFERKDKAAGRTPRRKGEGAGSRFVSKERRPQGAPVKKEEQASAASTPAAEKPAPRHSSGTGGPGPVGAPGQGRRPRGRRRPKGPNKEAGAGMKKEAVPEARPEKRRFERPSGDRRPRHRGNPPASAPKTEQKKTEAPAPRKTEPAAHSQETKEKGGLLKRFFKFLKKT